MADVESALRMELLLNLAWTLLASLMIGVWLRRAPRVGVEKRHQFVALAVLLLILFPVISVTDDLQALQNPAETDCCQRRSYLHAPVHPMFAGAATLPPSEFAGPRFSMQRMSIPGRVGPRVVARPELAPISSRPPPTA